MNADNSTTTYSGYGAAPGRATGKAYVIRNVEDIMAVPAGSILVVRILHPHLAPLLPRVLRHGGCGWFLGVIPS